MPCWHPLGLPVVPLVYIRNSGSSAVHAFRFHPGAIVFFQLVIDEKVAPVDHGGLGGVLAGIALPDQHFVDLLTVFFRMLDGDVRVLLVVEEGAAAVVGIRGDQHAAARVDDAVGAGRAAESAEHLGVDDAQAGAGQHGDGQLGNHGHVQGHPVTAFQAGKVFEQGGEFIHPHIQFLVGDVLGLFFQGFGNKVDGGLVLVRLQVTIDAVVAGVDLAALEPFVTGCIAGIQNFIPVFVPGQKVGIFLIAVGKIIQAEPVIDAFVRHVCLGDKIRGWIIVPLLLPVYGYLRLRCFDNFFFCHGSLSSD